MLSVPTLSECKAENREVDLLLWVGCAGSYDERYKKVMRSFVRLLKHANVSFATLGTEEGCTGDPAKRAGNEFLFQMQALSNIERLSSYGVRRIVTSCPHCFNTLRHEYPALGGDYEVMHHTTLLEKLVEEGRIRVSSTERSITYHDPCYLGRGNGIYEPPRNLLRRLTQDFREMKRSGPNSRCCGAGGAQIFKESEPGREEIHHQRSEEALSTGSARIASGCPFCMLMLSDGLRHHGREKNVEVQDLAEIIESSITPT